VTAPRVLLVESLDAAGSDRADARERCAALRALRAVVRVAIVSPGRDGSGLAGADDPGATGALVECDTGPAGFARLREFAQEGRFDLILLASATPGGGAAARALPPGVPATWWPTGVSPAPGWGARFAIGRPARLPQLGGDPTTSSGSVAPGLTWSSVGSRPAGRGRLTLWDGEYLLAPLPLAGDDGSRLLAAFAGLGSEWCGLDLVVLSEPQPGFEREARGRGIGPRVHFVGRAPREAEWAWWTHACGAVFAGVGPISGGFVLRGLDAGCPIVMLQSDGPGAAIRTWLERNRCTPAGDDPVAALAALLERGQAVTDATARGRGLAVEHGWGRTTVRLAEALPGLAAAAVRARPAAAA
jgi:hypothetical protein